LAAYHWEKTAKELGLKTFPEIGVELVKVETEKIEFIDTSWKKNRLQPTANTQRELISLSILLGV
jgi:hypothetical protein